MTKHMTSKRGQAICLMCGTAIGEVKRGELTHHSGCDRQLRWLAGLPRCCRCGGSVFFDPDLSTAGPIDYEELEELRLSGA